MRRLLTTAALTVAVTGLVAPVAQAADACSNAQYRTGASAKLPECRAYEQVTPVDKGGYPPFDQGFVSPGGNRLLFTSNANGAGSAGDSLPLNGIFASNRGSNWSTASVDPVTDEPASGFVLFTYLTLGISQDGSKALVISTRKLTPDAVAGASNFYVRDTTTRALTLAASRPGTATFNTIATNSNAGNVLAGSSRDFSHIVVFLDDQLYEITGGQFRQVNVDNAGNTITADFPGGLFSYFPSAAQPVVSDDGRRITFAAASFASPTGLYQRIDGTSTVSISRSKRATDPGVEAPLLAPGPWPSADGKRVVFAANGDLTDDGPGPLYRWDADGGDGRLTDLLADTTPALNAPSASSFSIVNVSRDARYVWFTYTDANSSNLLAVLDTASGTVSTEATFVGAGSVPGETTVRSSPDGTKLVVATVASLTGYDQNDPRCGGSCQEVFSFDAEQPGAGPLCVSCGAAGTHSIGTSAIGLSYTGFPFPRPSIVTNDGRVFFDTPQPLVASDVNDARDVYEYTPGQGPTLISTGVGGNLLSASPSGDDVFFGTADSLVAQDDDTDRDLYTARVGGGLAAQQVTRPTGVSCSGGSCPGPQPALPSAETPGTSTFRAPPRAPRFSVSAVSAAARRAAVTTGRLKVSVTVGAAGRLSARASARVAGRSATIGRASSSVRKAGRTTLTLTLSRSARRALARNHKLAVRLSVAYSRASQTKSQSFSLVRPRTRGAAKGGAR